MLLEAVLGVQCANVADIEDEVPKMEAAAL